MAEQRQAVPEGDYQVTPVGAAWDTTQSGSLVLKVALRVVGGEHAGRFLDATLWMDTDRPDRDGKTGRDKSVALLVAMGYGGPLARVCDGDGVGIVRGATLSAKVEHDAKGYARVKYLNPPRVFPPRAFSPPSMQDLTRLLGEEPAKAQRGPSSDDAAEIHRRLEESWGTRRPAPQRAPAPRQPPRGFDADTVGTDDIPF